jgi:nicotinate-nucleotide pyrophosphorylase (carboxylating)
MSTEETAKILEAASPLIELAIAEDIGPGDATSKAVLPVDLRLQGRIIAKSPGIIAGLPIAEAVFARVELGLRFISHAQDGDRVRRQQIVAEVIGPGRGMLAAERTATILDTRKTRPGYRVLEKYAVRMGGAQNHRMSLYDMLLVKDNHIEAAGSITAAVMRARTAYSELPIEVEVKNLQELEEALMLDVDRIMLDNMSLDLMQEAVKIAAGRVPLEASGNVELRQVAAVAAIGVDYISIGALTHSAPALDLSMLVQQM